MLYPALRPILFAFDAERVHEFAVKELETLGRRPKLLQAVQNRYVFEHPILETEAWNLRFPNPVGVAAGFDKNARLTQVLPALGFGFLEVGTVTSEAQPGNPRPRLFRLPKDRALINRLGFNNDGADTVRARLAKSGPPRIPLGINVGKAKRVPKEDAVKDYVDTFEKLFPFGSYFVVNVSSPNTPGLRELQERDALRNLLSALRAKGAELARREGGGAKPLLVKLAPDLSETALAEAIEAARAERVDGFVATNTTISREGLSSPERHAEGGLSGAPLRSRATDTIRRIHRATDGAIPIIGVGGIFTAADALEKIQAGASLVQVYTGFVYGGPATASGICEHLVDLLEEEGYGSVAEAVGTRA